MNRDIQVILSVILLSAMFLLILFYGFLVLIIVILLSYFIWLILKKRLDRRATSSICLIPKSFCGRKKRSFLHPN